MERPRLLLLIMMMLACTSLPCASLGMQDASSDSIQSAGTETAQSPFTTPSLTENSSSASQPVGGIANNFWDMTKQGGWLMWPIYGTFVLGIMIVIHQFVKLYFDKKRTPALLLKNLEEADIEDIQRMAEKHTDTHLGALINKLCAIHKRNKNMLALQEELEGHLQATKERFDVVKSFAVLLSDTAGALGLLGTVWGIYVTFMPGKLESQQIIIGMGIALVTTLGGLVVSIILNFGIAWINAAYHSRLEWVAEQAFIFRDRFGEVQAGVLTKHAGLLSGTQQVLPGAMRVDRADETKTARPQEPSHLKIISGESQTGEVGSQLSKPYEVRVLDQDGEPIKKQTVTFEANGSQMTFGDDQNSIAIETDSRGRARANVTLGPRVGRYSVSVRVNGHAELSREFAVESKPGLPERLIVISGNTQVANPGEQLPTPLALRLEDSFGNPVPAQIVSFKVIRNKGRFSNDRDEIDLTSDIEGMVSTSFWLANQAGSNAVRALVKSRSKCKLETYFESMGVNRSAS